MVFAPPEKIASDSHEMSRGAAEDSSGDEYESDEDYDDDDDEYSEEESEEESEPPGSHPLEGLPVPMPAAAVAAPSVPRCARCEFIARGISPFNRQIP